MSWKLYDKVTIVTKPLIIYNWQEHKTEYTGINQGYVVEYGNKDMLASAISWAKSTDNQTPKQFDFDNDGFLLTIYDSADGSSQGGKLSFMNCLIEKDNEKFLIGINSDLLVELIKNTTFINGVCQEKICFARTNGRVGALTKNMDSYKEAIDYINHSQKVNQKKTTKWIPGHIYETTTTRCRYVGEVYSWYDIEYAYSAFNKYQIAKRLFKIRNKPIKKYLICKQVKLRGKIIEYYEVIDKLPSRYDAGEDKTEEESQKELLCAIQEMDEEIKHAVKNRSYFYTEKVVLPAAFTCRMLRCSVSL